MKKLIFGLILVVGVVSGIAIKVDKREAIGAQKQVLGVVKVVVDDAEKVASYSATLTEGESALSVLVKSLDRQGISIKTKTFTFGTLVTGIDNKDNSNQKTWIYYVNGMAGEVAANEKMLSNGDVVEWKYATSK